MKTVLSIAGSDPSGGAGIQADLKTFAAFGVYGMAAVTLLTVQNTLGIKEVLVIHPDKIKAQILAVMEDIRPDAVKLGALGHAAAVHAVAETLKNYNGPIIADPVMVSKNGAPLLVKEAVEIYKKEILPLVYLVTPNLAEAAVLAGFPVESHRQMEDAARSIHALGARRVLVKGGHLKDGGADDLLFDGEVRTVFSSNKIQSIHTHGVGCTLASAIAAGIAAGKSLPEAVHSAKDFVIRGIENAPGLGKGQGPIRHG